MTSVPHDHGASPPSRLRIDRILGARDDPAYAAPLHALEHRGLVDIVWLPPAEMARRRILLRSEAGREVAIALPRSETLFDGAVLLLSQTGALLARAEPERWLRLEPPSLAVALQLGYHAGNLHWRTRFAGTALFVALEAAPEAYLDRLADLRDVLDIRIESPPA